MEFESTIAVVFDSIVDQNTNTAPASLLASIKTLKTLLQNAAKDEIDPKKLELYRKVRLSNPKIQERVVNVAGALDLLALAGFATNGEYLLYTPPEKNATEICYAIIKEIELKRQELELIAAQASPRNESPFLSDEERRKRHERAKSARKAKEAERALTQCRWQEDKEERALKLEREERAKAAQFAKEAGLAFGITIRSRGSSMPLATPMAAAPKPNLAIMKRSPEQVPVESEEQQSPADLIDMEESMASPLKTAVTVLPGECVGKKQPAGPDAMDVEDAIIKHVDEEFEDRKPAAKASAPVSLENDESWSWEVCQEHIPRCTTAAGVRDSSVFAKRAQQLGAGQPSCLKRLFKELNDLSQSLPLKPPIWVRFDEETPQYLRTLVAAPLGTPYASGLFCFDVYIPDNYPQVPPKVELLTTGGGSVRFGPNLYADGKVCLSLLGTWSGPKWSSLHSTLYQVLISIQGLILGVEHPYYLEPGHGGWEGLVKDGDFQVKGHTLSGTTVQEEVGVPKAVVGYEDVLRVGTVKYAMLETLSGPRHLAPFGKAIEAHFYQNRNLIINEVRKWLSDHSFGRQRQEGKAEAIDELNTFLPKLEEYLSKMVLPSFDEGEPNKKARLLEDGPLSRLKGDTAQESMIVDDTEKSAAEEKLDVVETKRHLMQEAAGQGIYVIAGKLQEELKRLEELQRLMNEAAAENNFIRAGRLQEQFQALTALDTKQKPSQTPLASVWYQDDSDDGEDHDVPMSGPASTGLPQPVSHYPPVPPGYQGHMMADHHPWGSGNPLGATDPAPGSPAVNSEVASAASVSVIQDLPKKPIPRDVLCRLRIRLPGDTSVVEDFDRSDSLSAVYHRLESLIPCEYHCPGAQAAVAPHVHDSAFSQPLSSAGYTLLLSHPKREFSLEMYGTKSLLELNLSPSATLTVMKCSDRGIVHRGELESRLREAQGNAMELDGLTYEGLVELTERVGGAAPSEGSAFVGMSEEDLQQNSDVMSPSSYLASLANMEVDKGLDENERRCPICLGEYDPADNSESVRKVTKCDHVFHDACLVTWLRTKSSCPLCKTSIAH